MRADDLPLLVAASSPTIDPSADRVVYAATRPDIDADAYVGQLWTVPLDGSAEPRRLTRGFRDTDPRFSPDGAMLAFLRAVPGEPPQLHVMDAAGGEPLALTDEKGGVSAFRWSPDGRRLAFRARALEHGRYGTVDGIGAGAEPPRRITTQRWRANGVGYTIDRRARIHLVDVPDLTSEPVVQPAPSAADPASGPEQRPRVPAARIVTTEDADAGAFAFSADGGELLVVAALHDTADTDLRSGVFAYPVDTTAGAAADDSEPVRREVVSAEHGLSIVDLAPAFDGALALLASDVGESGRDFVASTVGLWRADADGVPTRLTDEERYDFGDPGSTITVDEDRVLVQDRHRGRVDLLAVDVEGATTSLVEGVEVTGVAASARRIVVTYQRESTAGDVAVVDGGLRPLTDHSAPLRDRGVLEPRELTVVGRDGTDVHGWVVRPEGEGPHPTLLMIHGGPYAQYSVHLFDEAQVYADAGYAVVYCNPRGSAGYGRSHGRGVRQAMGTVDFHDVLDFLDGAIRADAALDGERVGILGGSYGGYLTAWTIAHDDRFAAAIVERGYLDPAVFVGTSDIGDFFTDEYVGTDPDRIAAQSPQAIVDRVTTPTLVIHSEQDLRCPLGQAERYYVSLKRNGVAAELLVFPGEDHELSRAGRPRHRVQRFEAILEWWQRYLPVAR